MKNETTWRVLLHKAIKIHRFWAFEYTKDHNSSNSNTSRFWADGNVATMSGSDSAFFHPVQGSLVADAEAPGRGAFLGKPNNGFPERLAFAHV